VASYFLPGFTLRRLLKKASKRGVKIKFIFGKRSDVPIVLHASHFFYSFLLRNNMRIYEWKQSVVHGKLLFVDGISVNIGSYNLNALSDYGSLELNAEVNDTDFASQVNHELQSIMQQSSEVNPDYFNQLGAVQKIMHYISYRVIRMALAVLFFLMRKER
jgi:cardiolipin synthase